MSVESWEKLKRGVIEAASGWLAADELFRIGELGASFGEQLDDAGRDNLLIINDGIQLTDHAIFDRSVWDGTEAASRLVPYDQGVMGGIIDARVKKLCVRDPNINTIIWLSNVSRNLIEIRNGTLENERKRKATIVSVEILGGLYKEHALSLKLSADRKIPTVEYIK